MARGSVMGRVPLLPTTVVGSYPVPEWMERLKTEYFRGRMSHAPRSTWSPRAYR